jgi:CheY-like chemotaxis protein
VKLLRATIPANVTLSIADSPGVPAILADASEIHQVLLNLGTNAWQAIGSRQGRITFSLGQYTVTAAEPPPHPDLAPGDYVRLTVRDNGRGIPPELLTRIFDPFFTTKAPGEGTGLGLSIAHGIMRSHRGAITVTSTVGQGTEFSLYFPVASGRPESASPFVSAPPAIPEKSGRGQHILCIDDEDTIIDLTGRLLRAAGYTFTGTSRPLEALALVRAEPEKFAVIITDFSMPEMSGIELAEEVRRIRPDFPIILASGYLRAGDAEAAQAAGIREILQKPQSLEVLAATVTRVLASSGTPS